MTMLFVDETKAKGYTMVAAVVVPGDANGLRKEMRGLVLKGQRRIHFTSESDPRRRLILSKLVELGVRAHIVQSTANKQADGREECLMQLLDLAADNDYTRIVLERDASIEQADRRILYREVSSRGLRDSLVYDHMGAHDEPLLWIADAIAWSHAKGGDWRRRVEPMLFAAVSTG
ncbi:hypothetical protein [Curtobacterium flaccumfaciens]|uniref:hypothetical protein n=1 Tax=Curtobacterium flaccumfaciens TaxID=2035 RepID=UPI001BDF3CDF|nr:hypothetical protein [Curtobacterium flaccumfaciens]MBT1608187.1 hypothetical protein [Curtobacterium flaccumfaciens pv. betae]MBT1657990.1 hypothetical protein [Curtobacterium flaccumfaciens pv. betae]MCS0470213.1 hypothetical protein [Curtobacterium flaccumfaciens pv. betae]MCS0474900.1 hypothetical protein [Curtobacterium flaccumfaciens pv. betae]MCS0479606.1 hypothetical protein [Curtobacterium flaccumfaciens pv. betae]